MSSGRSLVAHWDLSTDNPSDICWRGNRYPGTGANIVSHPNGIAGGRCAEFNGNNSNINVGDIVELNSVQKFTMAFWMNQDVIDATDYIFVKQVDSNNRIIFRTDTGGLAYCIVGNGANTYAQFDYSLYISATFWHHVAIVFDGSQTGDANRLKVYIDGEPITLTFNGTIPTATANMSGIDTTIGQASSSFDGKLDEFMIFDAALTQLQVTDLYERTRKGIM